MKTIYILTFTIISLNLSFGQKGLLRKEHSSNGTVSFAEFKADSVIFSQEGIQLQNPM
ncbi:MAG: hypothetical protein JST43_14175 [Bacteroidetes bacterium]|nr:hypothetical protein [Bacteroidota bacterium]MBS1539518.1 hypothetical protein [Bacteroidota bacterium]